jgi:hypothetical protein
MSETINCKEQCVNGCILGDRCPHLKYLADARKFVQDTAIDKIIEIATNRYAPKDQKNDEDID